MPSPKPPIKPAQKRNWKKITSAKIKFPDQKVQNWGKKEDKKIDLFLESEAWAGCTGGGTRCWGFDDDEAEFSGRIDEDLIMNCNFTNLNQQFNAKIHSNQQIPNSPQASRKIGQSWGLYFAQRPDSIEFPGTAPGFWVIRGRRSRTQGQNGKRKSGGRSSGGVGAGVGGYEFFRLSDTDIVDSMSPPDFTLLSLILRVWW